jgi:hypothetical protein
MSLKRGESKAFTVKFPVDLVQEIDQICAANYITRTSWLIKSARKLLESERVSSSEEILAKIANKEKEMGKV